MMLHIPSFLQPQIALIACRPAPQFLGSSVLTSALCQPKALIAEHLALLSPQGKSSRGGVQRGFQCLGGLWC